VRAAGIGNDMRAANAEALRMLAKVMGVSLKQVHPPPVLSGHAASLTPY
jgi:hypothetical protein